ncbi:hypothetical protein A3K63_00325 [Candidatus Micrarchaeota archaeon RBG_16_49_10]|nr:MAG: hypothetical protein A3K63_00325 [Candidatus Micrarchaeota archaeon RBG_16_49_10]
MDVFECIQGRRSVRAYGKESVPVEKIVQIIDAGLDAPSAGNTQPWEFIIVSDKKVKEEVYNVSLQQEHIKKASTLIVVLANKKRFSSKYGDRGRELYCIQDTAACTENMLLAAHALGLGACWVGAFDELRLKGVLGITDDDIKPVVILTIGETVPYEIPENPGRIAMDKITWAERYGEKPKWILPYQRKHRLSYEPLDQTLIKAKEKIDEKISQASEKEASKASETEKKGTEKPKKKGFLDFFRKLTR